MIKEKKRFTTPCSSTPGTYLSNENTMLMTSKKHNCSESYNNNNNNNNVDLVKDRNNYTNYNGNLLGNNNNHFSNNNNKHHQNNPILIEPPNFPKNTVKWNKNVCTPCKGVYTWISSPRAMYNNRKMVKNPSQEPPHTQNIMYDKRVVRGSNYSQNHMNMWNPNFAYAGLLSGKGGDGDTSKEDEVRRRQLLRKRFATQRTRRSVIGTPPPIRGRKHEEIQTEQYLEELHCRPTEVDVQCQTDLFLHRPPTPPYVPAKVGVDVDTEILDGELFNFDTEAQPLIETLVGRTIEQSLIEVVHEEEIADMKRQQQEFLAIREAEEAELRRLEAEEIRLQAEKQRRLRQEAIAREVDKDVQERVTAAKLLQGHIAQLLPSVLNKIEPYVEAENRDLLEKSLGPWLANEVAEEVGQMIDSRDLLEEIVREILEERAGRYIQMAEKVKPESLTQMKNENHADETDMIENSTEENVDETIMKADESGIVLTQNQNENNNNAGTKL